RDNFLAHGERISSNVAARAMKLRGLPAVAVDSRGVVITDDHFGRARPDPVEIEKRAAEILLPVTRRGEIPVVGGFIGSPPRGRPPAPGPAAGRSRSSAASSARRRAARRRPWAAADRTGARLSWARPSERPSSRSGRTWAG